MPLILLLLGLAGVTGLQSRSDGLLAADREPAVSAVEQLAAGHAGLTTALDRTRAAYNATVDAYAAAGGSLDALTLQLGRLSTLVGEIDGVSRSMPTSVKLPVVRSSVGSVRNPSTQSTTGASGG